MSGYHETQEALENVSSIKSNLDEEKAQKLEDISLMVQQLNNKIDRKKQILAPIIKELRPLRQEIQVGMARIVILSLDEYSSGIISKRYVVIT